MPPNHPRCFMLPACRKSRPATTRSSNHVTRTARLELIAFPFRASELCVRRDLLADPLLLLAELGRELGAEVVGLEHLPNLDLALLAGHRVGRALHPLDGLFLGARLDQPEPRDQLLGLAERTV